MAQNNNQSQSNQGANKKSQQGKTPRQSEQQTSQTSERGVENQPTGNQDLLDE